MDGRDGWFNQKTDFFLVSCHETTSKFFMKPKPFGLVLSLLSDYYIQGNTVEKDFQILIKLNFINIYTIMRGRD